MLGTALERRCSLIVDRFFAIWFGFAWRQTCEEGKPTTWPVASVLAVDASFAARHHAGGFPVLLADDETTAQAIADARVIEWAGPNHVGKPFNRSATAELATTAAVEPSPDPESAAETLTPPRHAEQLAFIFTE